MGRLTSATRTEGAGRTGRSEILELGDVVFFYRPRVGVERVDDPDDVQRLFFVLAPDRPRRYRRIVVGRKRLPRAEQHERAWAFVADVVTDPDELRPELGIAQYERKTTTRGVRVQREARPAGEGRYALVDHERHTHLAYVLELPPEPGPVQKELNIEHEASLIVAVRNPESPDGRLSPERRAHLPPELQKRFGTRRWLTVATPEVLDHEGVELVLIGAGADVSDLGLDLSPVHGPLDAAVFQRLGIRPDDVPVNPLLRGEWI